MLYGLVCADEARPSNIRPSIATDLSESVQFDATSGLSSNNTNSAPTISTPAKPGKGKKGCPKCHKHCGSAARTCGKCNHIFVPKSTAKKMSTTKHTPPSAAQPSPVSLFRLTAQQKPMCFSNPSVSSVYRASLGTVLLVTGWTA